MLLEALLIGGAALLNIGGLAIVKRSLDIKAQTQYRLDATRDDNAADKEEWFTVGVLPIKGNFSDTKREWWLNYILQVSNRGNRRYRTEAMDGQSHLAKHALRIEQFLLYVEPWTQGTISLDDLAASCKKLKLVPHKNLTNLSMKEVE